MKSKPDISVLICSYNRSESLKGVLEDLLCQSTNGLFGYEIIVVDNNSSDATKLTVDQLVHKSPDLLKYVFEGRQGKVFALNTGIKVAQGEIIVTTDDDCSFKEDYLKNIYNNFQNYPEDVVLIGGKISPQWINGVYSGWLDKIFTQSPQNKDGSINWIKINFEGPLGILDYGHEPILIDWKSPKPDTRRFYGANMAFRSSVFAKIGDFETSKTITEDTNICDRIFQAGFKGLYAPDVQVGHKISKNQYTFGFYYSYFFKRGLMMDLQESYARKFYHPVGIKLSLMTDTCHFILMSFNLKFDLFERAFNRCRALFNIGQMIQIVKKNII